MKTRVLSESQKAAAVERKERFRGLCAKLAGMSEEERGRWQTEAGLIVTIEGRSLSPRNTIICYFQRQGVTMVGGFRQWLKAGRCVRKGEHGLSILVPVGIGKDKETGEDKDNLHFIGGTVFDVSQTDELPVVESSGAGVAVTEGVA